MTGSPSSSHETAPYVPEPATCTATAPLPATLAEPSRAPGRGPVALVAKASAGPDAELVGLLRRRLRQMVLVFLGAYAAFLLRDLFSPARQGLWFQKIVFIVVTPVQLLLAAVTWSSWANSLRRLRSLEWIVLLVCWTAIGFIQLEWLTDWTDLSYYLGGTQPTDGQVLIANTWVIPWFALIAGYPAIIPNPPRRALLVAGLMALIPPAVTLAAMTQNPTLTFERTWMMFVQYAIWFPIGVGIAVYGAYQNSLLRHQVYEAQRFGQYKLARQIGVGGMGEVYLAEHLLLKRPSVIKTIRPERARDPAMLKRFEREVRILATLTHPNTVAVFDYGYTADGTFYYVMEYLPGMDLDGLVANHGAVPPGRAVHLVRQVCAALKEAHAVGLIHRDVKPSNVMVCRRGGICDVAKLLDFGLVRAAGADADATPDGADRITREGIVLGTPAFMSPEQAAGRVLDARSDVYSLGATAYFLLAGKPVFVKDSAMEVIAAHLMEKPRPLAEVNAAIPDDVDAVVLRCLAKNPQERFATVAELDAALRRCGSANEWDEVQAATWWEKYGASH